MRNNVKSNRHTAINALLSQLVKPAAPAAAKTGTISPEKIADFIAATGDLRTPGEVPEVSGKWLVCGSPFKWGDEGVQDRVQELKAAGFQSAFVKGGRIGVRLEHLAA